MLMLFGQGLSIVELVRTDRWWTIVKDDGRFEICPGVWYFHLGQIHEATNPSGQPVVQRPLFHFLDQDLFRDVKLVDVNHTDFS